MGVDVVSGAPDRDRIRDAVFRAIDEANELSLVEPAPVRDESAVLLGEGAALDSMGFVNFVVGLEEQVEQLSDRPFGLLERLNSPDGKSISTVGQVIDLVYDMLKA